MQTTVYRQRQTFMLIGFVALQVVFECLQLSQVESENDNKSQHSLVSLQIVAQISDKCLYGFASWQYFSWEATPFQAQFHECRQLSVDWAPQGIKSYSPTNISCTVLRK